MALLDFVPPALALVLHHGGLFGEDAEFGAEEIEQGVARAGDGGEELPAREDRCFCTPAMGIAGAPVFARACRNVCLEFHWRVAALDGCGRGGARPGETGVDGGEEFFGDGSFGEWKQERVVDG